MTSDHYIKIGKQTALVTSLIGTGIFCIYFQTDSFALLVWGYIFILLAGIINLGIFISILLKAYKDKNNRKHLLTTGGIMLLNIPLAMIYFLGVSFLLDTMRITFTNATQETLTDINITGCSTKHIDKLEPGHNKTVWVGISGDCTIAIDYLQNKARKEASVMGYVTVSMGQKIKYNIGGRNDELF